MGGRRGAVRTTAGLRSPAGNRRPAHDAGAPTRDIVVLPDGLPREEPRANEAAADQHIKSSDDFGAAKLQHVATLSRSTERHARLTDPGHQPEHGIFGRFTLRDLSRHTAAPQHDDTVGEADHLG